MHAFSAAKRTLLTVLCFCLVLGASTALADEEKSGYLGVMLQDVSSSMAKALQLGDKSGVMISEVVEDSPAHKAGLEDGDIILEFQGQPVGNFKALTEAVRQAKPGQTVDMVILHNGKKQSLKVELGERSDELTWVTGPDKKVMVFKGDGDEDFHVQMLKDVHEDMDKEHQVLIKKFYGGDDEELLIIGNGRGFMGVQLDDISGQMAEYFEIEDGKGALITEVNEDSPAAKAGLRAGDVIVKIGDQAVDSAGSVHKAMAGTKPEQEVTVKVMRKGDSKSFKVTLGDAPENMMFKEMKIITDDDHFTVTAPKMLFHGKGAPRLHEEFEWQSSNEELDQMRQDLQELKKELKELKKELKK
jgi:serine protease Do